MAIRYVLRTETDHTFSVIDIFTGQPAQYAGRALTALPLKLAETGLYIVNELDALRRERWSATIALEH
jgi:hypothetical protein